MMRQGATPRCQKLPAWLRPRVYIYPPEPGVAGWDRADDNRLGFLVRYVQQSRYHTLDGDCADFYIVHCYLGRKSTNRVHATFEYLARAYPWWNRTAGVGLTRHFLVAPGDHGPGDFMYDRAHFNERTTFTPPGSVVDIRDILPESFTRKVGFITFNGDPAPNPRVTPWGGSNCFRKGVDLRVRQK